MNISNLELKIVIGFTVLIFVTLVGIVFLGFKQETDLTKKTNVDIYADEIGKKNLVNTNTNSNNVENNLNIKSVDELNLETVQSAINAKIAKIKLESKADIVITPGEIKAKDLGSAEYTSGILKGMLSFESIGIVKTVDYKGVWLVDASGKVSLK